MNIFPFIILGIVVLVALGLAWNFYAEKKRRETIQKMADDLGLSFHPTADPSLLGELSSFQLFSQGRARKITNVLHGETDELTLAIFDYQYTIGSGKNSSTRKQTVTYCRSPALQVPMFALWPQHFFHNIGKVFGYKDIDFESHPTFSKNFVLRGPSETRIREFFVPAILEFFERQIGSSSEGDRDCLIYYRAGKRTPPTQYRQRMETGFELFKLFHG